MNRYSLIRVGEETPQRRAPTNDASLEGSALARRHGQIDASERWTRALMDHAEDAIFMVRKDGTIFEANQSAERLLGLPGCEIVGRRYEDLVSGAPASGPRNLDATRATSVAGRVRRPDGTAFDVDCTVALVDVGDEAFQLIIVRDASERTALAARLKEAQKLEAIGRLSGGVAHDFNNLLTVVISYADLLLCDMADDDRRRADVLEIRKAGNRAAELARQLVCFGRKQAAERKPVSMNDLVTGMLNMARRILGEDIELTTSLAADLGMTLADPTQLHQVLMNLVVNARDAMPEGGRLRVYTANVDVPPGHQDGDLPAGHYVRLTVADSGQGMDDATRQRIFEPFFTTKEPDRGTGLGLSTVLGIVQQHGGTVRVNSQPGKGARFHVYLPRTDVLPARRHISSTLPAVGPCGNETVLVVEDEEQVRTLLVDVLGRLGYTVIDASNAGEALLVAEEHDGPIHLLLTDLVMPRMSGQRLAERLLKLRPEMKVLLMSGYSDAQWPRYERTADDFPVLRKPVTPGALMQHVRKLLGQRSRTERGGVA